jgi:hypothetical protein
MSEREVEESPRKLEVNRTGMQKISYLTFNLGRHFVPFLSVRLMLRLSKTSAHRTQQLFAMSRLIG